MNREFIREEIVFPKEVGKKFAKKELRLKIQQIRLFLSSSSSGYFWTEVGWKKKENFGWNAEVRVLMQWATSLKWKPLQLEWKKPQILVPSRLMH